MIEWVPIIHYTQPLSIVFEVYCNNTLWTSGEFYPSSDRAIEVNVDGLDIGAYEFRIEMDHRIFHSVFVSVHPRNNTNPLSQLIHYGAIGISIGSSLVIIMVIVMTIRTRASYYSTIPA